VAYIRLVEESEAEGKLRELYEFIKKARGGVANILKVNALNLNSLKSHLSLYKSIMFDDSPLSREERIHSCFRIVPERMHVLRKTSQ